jgi:outer membrane protein assembly complex protein YaeT
LGAMWAKFRQIAIAAFIACAVLSSGQARAQYSDEFTPDPSLNPQAQQVSQRQPWRLEKVTFKGFDNITPSQAAEVMELKPPGLLQIQRFPIFDYSKVSRDRKRLLQLYQEHGYFQAKVKAEVVRDRVKRMVQVHFTADEGIPVKVEKVELSILPKDLEASWKPQLLKELPIKAGEQFQLAKYQEAKRLLGRMLADEAHPLNKVAGQVLVYPHKKSAVVKLRAELGPRVLFGPVRVEGNKKIGRDYILEAKTFVRGQPFSSKVLDQTKSALLDSGFFSAVNPEPMYDEIQDNQVPIKLQVTERDSHSVRLGLGWGNEDLFRVRILQVNRNMFGWNETFTIEGKVSAIYQGIVGRIKVPYFFNLQTNLLLSGGLQQENNEAYEYQRLFVSPMVEYQLAGKWRFFIGYNAERDHILDLKADVPDPEEEEKDQYISSVPFGFSYDGRDSILNPTSGTFFRLHVEAASDAIGSDVEFVRPVADLRHVLPLRDILGWKKWYLAARAKGGIAYPLPGTDRIPLVRRFFPGGADSVRGYPYQKLGPLDESGKPLGGEAFVEGSLELRFPLVGELGGVIFSDAGNAYESFNTEIGSLRFTVGGGLRYHTPVGPLRLDFGYQLNPPSDPHFSRYEVYLSVGQAF